MLPRAGLAQPKFRLIFLGIFSALIYGWVTLISLQFHATSEPSNRPLLTVLSLLGGVFIAYMLSCCEVWAERECGENEDNASSDSNRGPIVLIVGFGILFRLIMLFSVPIQEIDFYRYIVDGFSGNADVSPYEFAPAELVSAVDKLKNTSDPERTSRIAYARSTGEQETLSRLTTKILSEPGLDACLQHVHYGDYTSPYPPVSQAVFRIAAWTVPKGSKEWVWVLAIKTVLTLFDVLTGCLLVGLLRNCGLPDRLSLIYWWCPLAMKEIANSGHLDSIAICLTVGFARLVVSSECAGVFHGKQKTPVAPFVKSLGAAIVLGLAVGAKIYPLVLAPVWFVFLVRRSGLLALVPMVLFTVVGIACVWPVVKTTSAVRSINVEPVAAQIDKDLVEELRQKGSDSNVQVLRRPQAGIEMFSRYWEINDLIFMFIVENVRPNQQTGDSKPWFLITTEQWRSDLANSICSRFEIEETEFAFSFTRVLTLSVYCALVVMFCVCAWRVKSPTELLRLFFLSIAWFWLLSPTQNPWYWLWALPFLPFVKRPVPWLCMSGCLFLYYLRFYYLNHFANESVWPTSYTGQLFFDFIIPWIEFSPILGILLVQSLRSRMNVRAAN